MIEAPIYTRLSNYDDLAQYVGTRIFPTVPTEDTQLPFLTYTVTGAEPQLLTNGADALTRCDLEINAWGINLDTVLAVLAEAKAALHTYRDGSIQGSFLSNQSTQPEEAGYHGVQTYTVWALAL